MAGVAHSRSIRLPAVRRALLLLGLALLAALGCWRIVVLSRPVSETTVLTDRGVTYSVTHVEQVTGLSADDLAGMSHGIQGLVSEDKVLIRISMTVRAVSASRTYDPRLLTIADGAGGTPISPVGGSLAPGGLGAGAQIEGSLAFVVPRNGHHFSLHAPGNAHGIDLLTVDLAATVAPAPGAGHQTAHQHEHETAPAHQHEHETAPAHQHGTEPGAPHDHP